MEQSPTSLSHTQRIQGIPHSLTAQGHPNLPEPESSSQLLPPAGGIEPHGRLPLLDPQISLLQDSTVDTAAPPVAGWHFHFLDFGPEFSL